MQIALIIFIISILIIGLSFALLSKFSLGDERDKLVLLKASKNTLTIIMIALLVDNVVNIARLFQNQEVYKMSPFVNLLLISLVFVISIIRNRRKLS